MANALETRLFLRDLLTLGGKPQPLSEGKEERLKSLTRSSPLCVPSSPLPVRGWQARRNVVCIFLLKKSTMGEKLNGEGDFLFHIPTLT